MTVRAKRPRGKGWRRLPLPAIARPSNALDIGGAFARYDGTKVFSMLVVAELPGEPAASGPTWHLSVSRYLHRPSDALVRRVLQAFDLVGAEEDNHNPGIARDFFQPVDSSRRGLCECKLEEETVVEPDGYTWTSPHRGRRDPRECRGCQYEQMVLSLGRHAPCPIHRQPKGALKP